MQCWPLYRCYLVRVTPVYSPWLGLSGGASNSLKATRARYQDWVTFWDQLSEGGSQWCKRIHRCQHWTTSVDERLNFWTGQDGFLWYFQSMINSDIIGIEPLVWVRVAPDSWFQPQVDLA